MSISFRKGVAFVVAFALIAGLGLLFGTSAPEKPAKELAAEYKELLRRVEAIDASTSVDRWSMSNEHCLLLDSEDASNRLRSERNNEPMPPTLRERVVEFVRTPGGLDFIFQKLLAKATDDDEIFADSQMLVFAGGYHRRLPTKGGYTIDFGEVLPPSRLASQVVAAANHGAFASAEKRWPAAPIREKILQAAIRATNSRSWSAWPF